LEGRATWGEGKATFPFQVAPKYEATPPPESKGMGRRVRGGE